MDSAVQLYIILVIAGMFLIGAEIFLPGGVIGVMGGLALLAAVFVGFAAFGPHAGLLSALLIIIVAGICIVIWIKFFPKTAMGKSLTLSKDGKAVKSGSPEFKALEGRRGIVLSTLRPAGIADIDGRRVDVVADGSWIQAGKTVVVTQVDGVRVIVREDSTPTTEGKAK
jgi:membrane-bound serine protease (ClpP class)